MRKMWSLDPAIRDHVGLSEYAWDFNQPGAMRGFGPLEAGRAVVDFLSAVGRVTPADAGGGAPPAERSAGGRVRRGGEPAAARDAGGASGRAGSLRPLRRRSRAEASGSENPSRNAPRPRHGGAVPR